MLRRRKSLRVVVDGVILRRVHRRKVLRRLVRDVVVVIYHDWLLVTIPAWRRSEVTSWLELRLRLRRILIAVRIRRRLL
jgi:hypothetical protein